MRPPLRGCVRRRGWLALAVSLALHGALVGALTALPGGAAKGPATEAGPVDLDLVEEAGEEPFFFLAPGQAPRAFPPAQAPKPDAGAGPEVAVHHSDENIVPVAQSSEQPPGTAAVDPALF